MHPAAAAGRLVCGWAGQRRLRIVDRIWCPLLFRRCLQTVDIKQAAIEPVLDANAI